jgi:hypothetical protein
VGTIAQKCGDGENDGFARTQPILGADIGAVVRKFAANIAEAIGIATEGMRSGEWNLFRGQTNADWFVTSSAERLPKSERGHAFEQVKRLVGWANTITAMKPYFSNPDSLWAIAQHYGLKTNFIDFSDDPRVAAFFACDMKAEPAKDQSAAIICLNSDDFLSFWKKFGPHFLEGSDETKFPSLIRIDVDNLWRLQKQRGSFLWNSVYGIERIYDFDRIIFPYVKNDPSLPNRNEIYPIHQSELEKLLTQFFMNEQMIEGNRAIAALNVSKYKIGVPVDNYEAASWCRAGIAMTSDWLQSDAWDKRQVEHSDATLPGIQVELDPSCSLEEISRALCLILSPEFIESNRGRALDILATRCKDFDRDCVRLFARVRRLWNGMRTLPYLASEINTAFVRTIELFAIARQSTDVGDAFGSDSVYVEMASSADGYGAYSRAAATSEALSEAFNPEFARAARQQLEVGNPAFRDATNSSLARAFLQLAGRPWERFAFAGLRKLMVEQLIPTQVAWRVSSDERDLRIVIYFSPKDFKIFGLA